eukprot:491485-Pelagomonas_calceolata.AAC.2
MAQKSNFTLAEKTLQMADAVFPSHLSSSHFIGQAAYRKVRYDSGGKAGGSPESGRLFFINQNACDVFC